MAGISSVHCMTRLYHIVMDANQNLNIPTVYKIWYFHDYMKPNWIIN